MKRISLSFIATLALLVIFNTATAATTESCPAFPYFKPTTGPLAMVNCDFHTQYEARVKQISSTFGARGGRPVILNLGGTLLFKYNGKTETVDITPLAYHGLKTFSHGAFSIYLVLSQTTPGQLSTTIMDKLHTIRKNLKTAKQAIPTLELSEEAQTVLEKLASTSYDFLDTIITMQHCSANELDHYYTAVTPLIFQVVNLAGKIELQALDTAVNRWLASMTSDDKSKLGIVVATAHQARHDEISSRYFAKKFSFRYGIGAQHENGLVVLEGKFDEASALTLLARHYLDRDAGQVMFNNPDRLQRDMLGDVTIE